jgi:predicted metalloprotease with PDZ domain
MFASASFKTVYWAGAAFALIADVEVRKHTGGRLSLDAVLRKLAPYFRSQPRVFSAAEVMTRMDEVVGAPLFAPLMQRWVQGPELPQLDTLYTQLGVSVSGENVQFTADAEDAWIRSAIMQPVAPAAAAAESTADASR